jgi:hypothetical protein
MFPEGDPAAFSCDVEGQPMPEISWHYNDQPIKVGPQYRLIDEGYTFSLTLPQTTPENSGKYSLKAKNKFGEEELSAELVVKGQIMFAFVQFAINYWKNCNYSKTVLLHYNWGSQNCILFLYFEINGH